MGKAKVHFVKIKQIFVAIVDFFTEDNEIILTEDNEKITAEGA